MVGWTKPIGFNANKEGNVSQYFIITDDKVEGNAPGQDRPSVIKPGAKAPKEWAEPVRIRILDDDGEVYYYGYATEEWSDGGDGYNGLIQAWQWAAWYAGATALEARYNGTWELVIG